MAPRRNHPARHLVLALAIVSLAATSARVAADDYEDALTRVERFDYEGAVIALKNKLRSDPGNLPASILLGKALLELGSGAAAEAVLEQARRAGADEVLVLIPIARAYMAQGEHERVLGEITVGHRTGKLASEIHTVRGEAHLALQNGAAAAVEFKRAMALDPLSAEPRVGLAQVALARGHPRIAAGYTAKALLLDSEKADAWYVDGEARRLGGDAETAVTKYGRAIALNPRHFGARVARAALLIDLGREEQARVDIEAVQEHDPEQPQAQFLDAFLLARSGDLAAAEALLQSAAATLSDMDGSRLSENAPALLLAGVVSEARGNYEGAREHLERYLELDPRNLAARRVLATVLLRLSDADGAIRVLRPAISQLPGEPGLHQMLGRAYMQKRAYREANAALRKALELAPDSTRLRVELAQSHLGADQVRSAVTELEKAIELNPRASVAIVMLGRIRLQQRRPEPALEAARRALEVEPRYLPARLLQGDAQLARGELDAAAESYARALEVEAGRMPARFGLAAVELRRGNSRAARQRYEEILEEQPRAITAMVGLARVAQSEGHSSGAVRWLEKARSTDARVVAPQLALVDLHLRAGDTSAAHEAAQALESSTPDDPRSVEGLARTYLARGELTKARRHYARIALMPAATTTDLTRVASAQLRLEDPTGARTSLRMALDRDPDNVAAEAAMVSVDVFEKKLDAALERARWIQLGYPQLPSGWQLVGDVLMLMSRPAEATDAYVEAMERGQSTALAVKLFRSRWAAERVDAALEDLQGWAKAHPGDRAAREVLAGAYLSRGQLDVAEPLYQRLLEETPENPGVLNSLAWIYQKRGDDRALETIERAHAEAPDDAGTLDTYGWILLENGRPEDALDMLRKAESRAAENPWVRYHLALALDQLGRDAEALAMLDELFRSGRPFEAEAEARALLARLNAK